MIKPGDSLTMADVVEAIEGPLAINQCLRESYNCSNKSSCSVRRFLLESQSRFVEYLSSKTFAELTEPKMIKRTLPGKAKKLVKLRYVTHSE